MRKIQLIALWLVALTARAQVNYKVNVENAPKSQTLYLVTAIRGNVLDSLTTDTQGRGTLEGQADEGYVVALTADKEHITPHATFLLDGQDIEFIWDEGQPRLQTASNTNKSYLQMQQAMSRMKQSEQQILMEYSAQRLKYQGRMPDSTYARLIGLYESNNQKLRSMLQAAVQMNRNNLIPVYLIRTNTTLYDTDFLSQYVANYPLAKHEDMKPILTLLEGESYKIKGTRFADISMKNLAGETVRLSDWVGRGQYVLVDCWASWCGPCRQEMPHVKEAYATYHPRGFEIVGISLDNKQEAWQKAVTDMGITWPQMSDLKGWQCEAAKLYNIRSIPATILFDPEGKVVATDLRGDALARKLEKLIK